ncbi:MurR/RpiR family transcriptional regulator [Oceanisphaera arctica]|uniref:RpiR family transcriptional regulator n=1 Tax=Oceanisphaera arctica TaxID=641510 RepID=A0A2P5TK23_9GAMM|nr:MurR/RpiR family transcriptional regulator [Oceanisphaera arctica]PPL15428.1 RpiR family transcriptional regulator [Oceanisphaera arctica]GHA22464.1 RpiR family transcriptional regulator [Oceanisphaera arctica]
MTDNMQPPQTLEALRSLLADIEQGKASISLGGRAKRTLAAMLTAPQQAAVMTITELAEAQEINPSTLSRLAQRLGFKGFSDFQDLFRRELTEGRHFYSDQASRLVLGSERNSLNLLTRLARQESANLLTLVENMDAVTFEQSAELLANAPKVRIHSMRQFGSLASFISYALGMLRSDVAMLDNGLHGTADGLAQLEAGDVLLVTSCFPYTNGVLGSARVAAEQGIRIIAFTDTPNSPLAKIATHSFYVPSQSLFFSNSMCAFMLLAEGLLTQVANLLGERAIASLKKREQLIAIMNTTL